MTDEGAAAAPDPPPEVFGARAASSDPPLGEFGAGATPSDQPSPAPPDPSAPAAPPEPPFAPGLAGPPATARAGPNPDPASVAGSGREAYAGLVSRLLALAVDAALLAIVVPVVGVLAPGLWSAVAGSAPEWLRVCSGVLACVTPFAYFWLCWCTAGRTAGGLLLGTAVRRPDGGRVSVPRAAARAFLGLLFALFAFAGLLLIVVDPRRRALHDVLLRTVVRRT